MAGLLFERASPRIWEVSTSVCGDRTHLAPLAPAADVTGAAYCDAFPRPHFRLWRQPCLHPPAALKFVADVRVASGAVRCPTQRRQSRLVRAAIGEKSVDYGVGLVERGAWGHVVKGGKGKGW